MKLPTVTVCFKDLTVTTEVYVGDRALPSTVNAYRNLFEARQFFHLHTLLIWRHVYRVCLLFS